MIRKIARRLLRPLRPRRTGPAVLMYHRVANLPSDPWGLVVSPDNFAAQLRLLRRTRTVFSMEAFAEGLRHDRLPRDAVAITFDDGYVDNLRHAAPLLAAAEMPATLFLATGPMLRERAYWWDELAAMLLDAPRPANVSLDLGEESWRIGFGEREALDDRRNGWRAWQPRTQRETSYQATWARLRVLAPQQREAAMAQLRRAFPPDPAVETRPMTRGEIGALLRQGWFGLGGHTADHPDLLSLDDAAAFEQIARGKKEAEDVAGRPLSGFAYPFGLHDERVRRLAGEAGFDWACATGHAFVGPTCDLLAIPRISAADRADLAFMH